MVINLVLFCTLSIKFTFLIVKANPVNFNMRTGIQFGRQPVQSEGGPFQGSSQGGQYPSINQGSGQFAGQGGYPEPPQNSNQGVAKRATVTTINIYPMYHGQQEGGFGSEDNTQIGRAGSSFLGGSGIQGGFENPGGQDSQGGCGSQGRKCSIQSENEASKPVYPSEKPRCLNAPSQGSQCGFASQDSQGGYPSPGQGQGSPCNRQSGGDLSSGPFYHTESYPVTGYPIVANVSFTYTPYTHIPYASTTAMPKLEGYDTDDHEQHYYNGEHPGVETFNLPDFFH